ncbi:MAG: HNH endonuclease [Butyrivibrio sp.]|nr:HNH endonuclease [Butyrivibrio sp.]MBQ7636437.1 HNH endonuclease [Lachnospiraceae bacterium]
MDIKPRLKPKKPCHHPGCPNLTDNYYCDVHAPEHRGDRASSGKRGYGSKWQKARANYLRRHPYCVRCYKGGVLTEATVVDHIVPHRGDPKLFWDETNWQSLCKPCHDKKTWNEDATPEYKY